MTVKWHIRCFLALVLTLLSADSFAAEFICDAWGPIDATSVDRAAATELYPSGRLPNPDGCRSAILLKGAILPGDGERFAKLLRQSHPFLSSVMLWSPGGSVEDAMKIGRLIRKGLIDTEAPSGTSARTVFPWGFGVSPMTVLVKIRQHAGRGFSLTARR